MRNYGDIRNDFLVKMNQSTTAAFYTEQIIKDWFDDAHFWAAAMHKWPFTEGRYSTTSASATTNEDGWTALQYPEGFRTDSVRLMTVGGKRFDKKNFYKWQQFIQDNTSDTSKVFTDFNRTVYVNPNASDFSGTVTMWGQINVAEMAYDTSSTGVGDPNATTIFTDIENDGNEAILEKMLSFAYQREKSPTSMVRGKMVSASAFHESLAQAKLDAIWKRVAEEQYAYQDTLNEGMFKRFDVTRGGFKEDIFRRDQWGF